MEAHLVRKCPIIVAKEIVGAYFSRDLDSAGVDAVRIGEQEYAANGSVQYYISCKLFDHARNDMRPLSTQEYERILSQYYPMVTSGGGIVDADAISLHVVDKSHMTDILEKQASKLVSTMQEKQLRMRSQISKLAQAVIREAPEAPETYTPQAVSSWLKEVSKWIGDHGGIVPGMRRRQPRRPEFRPVVVPELKSADQYRNAIKSLVELEVEVCKYLSRVEDYYAASANYINDLIDCCKK